MKNHDTDNDQYAMDGNACYSLSQDASHLLVNASDSDQWVLPWSYYLVGRYSKTGDKEKLSLVFTTHEVELYGSCFGDLVKALAGASLATLCIAPHDFSDSDTSETFIEEIQVRQHKDVRMGTEAA